MCHFWHKETKYKPCVSCNYGSITTVTTLRPYFNYHSTCYSNLHQNITSPLQFTIPNTSPTFGSGYYRPHHRKSVISWQSYLRNLGSLTYDAMKIKYEKCISIEVLTQCCQIYDMQLSEGMNRSVNKYVYNGTTYCRTTSLITPVYLATGIQLVEHHFFWLSVMLLLSLSVPAQTELHLLDLDKC